MKDFRNQFLNCFAAGDVDRARKLLEQNPTSANHSGYGAHPLLREFVHQNDGHCYKASHLQIADLLTSGTVRAFRDAVLDDDVDPVQTMLRSDLRLIHAEFTAGRGIAQAIHHWRSIDMGRILVRAGGDLASLTTRGESPLTTQIRFGTVDGVRLLLEQGADPNHGSGGHMPTATMDELIPLLLAHGWNINNGQMLHDANHGFGSRVQTWLKYGADPNARNAAQQTALHLFAARGTGQSVITALVEAGADLHARDADGDSPLDLARRASPNAAERQLRKLGAGAEKR